MRANSVARQPPSHNSPLASTRAPLGHSLFKSYSWLRASCPAFSVSCRSIWPDSPCVKLTGAESLAQAQEPSLVPTDAWHTACGRYPLRLLGFVADDLAIIQTVRASSLWQGLIRKLDGDTKNLRQRVASFRGGFQW